MQQNVMLQPNIDDAVKKKYIELNKNCNNFSEKDLQLMDNAFLVAYDVLSNTTRDNGNPFMFHAIAVAQIVVVELGLSAASVIAVFLHEAMEKSQTAINLEKFEDEILHIVDGLNKISKIDIKTTGLQADNFRKLIVSYSKDPRVALIKLADRLEVMRSLSFFSPLKQMQKSTETMLLYAPLAHQLGLYNLKGELENIAFRYLDNHSYRLVANKLKSTTVERDKFVAQFIKPIESELKRRKYKYEIKSRTKTAYSIWRKMQNQNIDFEDVYDVFAIRIIIDTPLEREALDCFEAYSIIENLYTPDVSRYREWITRPKKTGYQSLHTTVETADGRFVEVQIRTTRMDEIAEKGVAAHWRYKGVERSESIQTWLNNVRELLETSEIASADIKKSFIETEIFVYTPQGDLRRLPIGATVLDFAFDIHTNIGSQCVGARVNGKNATIRERLKTGDTVEITTSKNQTPKPDWLNVVVTSKAKTRIRAKLREEQTESAKIGREMMDRRLKNWKLSSFDEAITTLTKFYKLKHGTEFYAMLGNGKITLADVKDALNKIYVEQEEKPIEIPTQKITTKQKSLNVSSDYLIIDSNLQNVSYTLAKCCNPIKGNEIFGFVTINSGIKIHRFTCSNASRLLEKYPYRIIKTKWRKDCEGSFSATIRIVGSDEIGMLTRISEVLQKAGVDIRSVNIDTQRKGVFEGKIQIAISGSKQLDFVLHKLQQTRGIDKAHRIS